MPDSNIPMVDLATALNPSSLEPWIDYHYSSHVARTAELMAAHGRFLEATANGINDDVIAGRASDFTKQLKAEQSAIDDTRTKIKAPVLHAQRLIDGQAKKITDQLTQASASVQTKLTTYLRDKEAKARELKDRGPQ